MPFQNVWHRKQTVHIEGEPYTLLNQLGEGKFGSVWTSQTPDGSYAAVKMFDFNFSRTNINSIRRFNSFKTEIEIIRRLQNETDYIVTLYTFDFDRHKQLGFIVMELGNITLKDQIKYLHQTHNKSKKTGYDYISDIDRKNIWIQLVNIICALHRHNIVHRDVKPANFVFFGPTLKLIDFGIALDVNSHQYHKGGCYPYSAPECFVDGMLITTKADIWSIGIILYILTYGKPPVYKNSRAPMNVPQTRSNLVQSVLFHSLQENPFRRADHHWLFEHPLTKSNTLF